MSVTECLLEVGFDHCVVENIVMRPSMSVGSSVDHCVVRNVIDSHKLSVGGGVDRCAVGNIAVSGNVCWRCCWCAAYQCWEWWH